MGVYQILSNDLPDSHISSAELSDDCISQEAGGCAWAQSGFPVLSGEYFGFFNNFRLSH